MADFSDLPDFATNPLVVPLTAPLWDSNEDKLFREPLVWRSGDQRSAVRPRALRVPMDGSGYQVVVEGRRRVSLVNLSLSGAQVRGALTVLPQQPLIVNIGTLHEARSCGAIARVRWVQPDRELSREEEIYRIGLAFETWDVRRLKEILDAISRRHVPKSELIGVW